MHDVGSRRPVDDELNIFAEQPREEIANLGEDRRQVDRARLPHLPSAEREQLPREVRRTAGGALEQAPLDSLVRALETVAGGGITSTLRSPPRSSAAGGT